jgi:hypothetical protein
MFKIVFYAMCMFSLLMTQQAKAETVILTPFIVGKKNTQPTQIKNEALESHDDEETSNRRDLPTTANEEIKYTEIHDAGSSLEYFFERRHDSCAGRICFGLIPIPIPVPGAFYQSNDNRVQILFLTTGADRLLMFRYRF